MHVDKWKNLYLWCNSVHAWTTLTLTGHITTTNWLHVIKNAGSNSWCKCCEWYMKCTFYVGKSVHSDKCTEEHHIKDVFIHAVQKMSHVTYHLYIPMICSFAIHSSQRHKRNNIHCYHIIDKRCQPIVTLLLHI